MSQPVQNGAVLRARFQPGFLELPQVAVGFVVEGETPVGAEDRDGGRNPVERPVVGGNLTVESRLRPFQCGHVDCDACARIGQRDRHDLMRLLIALNDEAQPVVEGFAGFERALDRPPLPQFE